MWENAPQLKDGPLTLSCFAQRHTSVLKQRNAILKDFTNTVQAPQRVQNALNKPEALDSTTVKEFEIFILCTFIGKVASKEEAAQSLWNLIFDAAIKSINMPYRYRIIALITSKNHSLTSYMENYDG